MLIKLKVTISLILLTLFCSVTVFSQDNKSYDKRCEKYEALKKANFTSEKISLNVVNADVRDVLNYITEQYDYQFLIDKSVKEVPITVSVNNVSWKIALEKILESKEMSWQIHCMAIRITTIEQLKEEAGLTVRVYKERKPKLFTEFIKLKNVPKIQEETQDNKETDFEYKIGIAKFISIIQKRLSKQGTVEFDCRSKTVIITDTSFYLNSLIKLIGYLDNVGVYKLTKEENKEYKKYEICSLEN